MRKRAKEKHDNKNQETKNTLLYKYCAHASRCVYTAKRNDDTTEREREREERVTELNRQGTIKRGTLKGEPRSKCNGYYRKPAERRERLSRTYKRKEIMGKTRANIAEIRAQSFYR